MWDENPEQVRRTHTYRKCKTTTQENRTGLN